ncbi:hypothetical protein Tco_1354074 [Tanacetum coccineum]
MIPRVVSPTTCEIDLDTFFKTSKRIIEDVANSMNKSSGKEGAAISYQCMPAKVLNPSYGNNVSHVSTNKTVGDLSNLINDIETGDNTNTNVPPYKVSHVDPIDQSLDVPKSTSYVKAASAHSKDQPKQAVEVFNWGGIFVEVVSVDVVTIGIPSLTRDGYTKETICVEKNASIWQEIPELDNNIKMNKALEFNDGRNKDLERSCTSRKSVALVRNRILDSDEEDEEYCSLPPLLPCFQTPQPCATLKPVHHNNHSEVDIESMTLEEYARYELAMSTMKHEICWD